MRLASKIMGIPKTMAEVEAHNARVASKKSGAVALKAQTANAAPDAWAGKESELHQKIESELKRRRWLFIHSRTDRATTTAKGVPDFVIFPGQGKTIFVEVKTKTGKLRPEQRAWQYCAEILVYEFRIVRSFEEFLTTIEITAIEK